MNSSIGGRWAWPLFLALAYDITWAVQIPAYLYLVPRGIAPTNEANFLLLSGLGAAAFWIVILHGYANAWQSYVMLSSGSFTAQVVYGVLLWALAAWLLRKYDAETLTRRAPQLRTRRGHASRPPTDQLDLALAKPTGGRHDSYPVPV